MKVTETKLAGCFIIAPSKFEDSRGYFFESFNEAKFQEAIGANTHFVQDNQSFSRRGVLRGLHAQAGEHAQAKLVRVLQGEVLDVAVDVRPGSETFGQHVAIQLSDRNMLQLYIPRGFLHGFVVLSKTAEFFYKCDNYYHKASEAGIRFDDPALRIDWLLPSADIIISEKDNELPLFSEVYTDKA
ncbi:dTDP-4-dehydrorhamnose 3,5-epimerase [Parapedobacter luteus]|uniref:dTDP-4-dehydrorhamnose 3,5-epimerase n=1 Tax=Parapedobacter luteus TaxID=623280 RepID=A0A1T5DF93_9SPHI|nr:dTDP-4-dehydrorhamnose 3,5-epimerase [Parapedobacter luteus]SKB70336.1 dTDP-4-dehydrorhamnose 3,5-epimerase [Parapedobacter luteus]